MRTSISLIVAALLAALALSCSSSTEPNDPIVLLQTAGRDFRIVDIRNVVVPVTIQNNTTGPIEIIDCTSYGLSLEVFRDGAWKDAYQAGLDCSGTIIRVPARNTVAARFELSPYHRLKTGMYRFRLSYFNDIGSEPHIVYSNVFRVIVEWEPPQ